MKRSKSKISRELKRNTEEVYKVYLPDTAEEKMKMRRKKSKKRFQKIDDTTIEEIKQRLKQHHSPEQLSGRMKHEGLESVSHETIYLMIYSNYQEMGIHKEYLRQKQKKQRRKGINHKRGGIPNRVGIENRPQIAAMKTEIGHWESDTVIGCDHSGVVVTHVDKASKYLIAGLAKKKTKEEINRVTMEQFKDVKRTFCKTMTLITVENFVVMRN